MTTPNSGPPAGSIPLFDAWKEYQQIAMHFNDLLMRLRSQSLAAVGALASVAGFAFNGQAGAAPTNWHALSAAFAALAVFWIAIWVLDFMYYNRLLLGAVNALLAIEKTSANGATTLRELNLSHDIEAAVANGTRMAERDRRGRWIFYVLVFVVLLAGLVVSVFKSGMISLPQEEAVSTPKPAALLRLDLCRLPLQSSLDAGLPICAVALCCRDSPPRRTISTSAAIVRGLVGHGILRRDIGHEITLGTASGQADGPTSSLSSAPADWS